jgi:hypothetical protein
MGLARLAPDHLRRNHFDMMKPTNSTLLLSGVAGAVLFGAVTISALPAAAQSQAQERIYGSQMMTEQERNSYRDRMRSAESTQQRERIRAEHHEQMRQRAKERGVTLPDDPPAQGMGKGLGPGQGMGTGRGPGGGMGGGMGPGGGGRR